jgi:hypothetical protein
MFCPETTFACNRFISIWHNGNSDIQWKYRSLKERLNPLRWSVFLIRKKRGYLIRINRDGRLNFHWSNFVWNYLGGEKRAEKRWAQERRQSDLEFERLVSKREASK